MADGNENENKVTNTFIEYIIVILLGDKILLFGKWQSYIRIFVECSACARQNAHFLNESSLWAGNVSHRPRSVADNKQMRKPAKIMQSNF